MGRFGSVVLIILGSALLVAWSPDAIAYDRYNSGCNGCHGAFTDGTSMKGSVFPSDNKHEMHRNSSNMNTECNLCHTTGDQRNPYIKSSNGTANNPGLGCNGCHLSAGLRAHHADSGVTACATCHISDPPPLPENTVPTYYGTVDTYADNPCNADPSPNVNENWTVGDSTGLDNDGDGFYDAGDSDCGAGSGTPGETQDLMVDADDGITLSISFDNTACSVTDNNLYFGPLDQVSSYNYTGQECDIGNSGTYDWIYPANPESVFFLIGGHDAVVEGPYGKHSDGSDRPYAGFCPETRDLSDPCGGAP